MNFFSWFTKAHLGLLKILELSARHIRHYLKLQWWWLTVDKLHSASVRMVHWYCCLSLPKLKFILSSAVHRNQKITWKRKSISEKENWKWNWKIFHNLNHTATLLFSAVERAPEVKAENGNEVIGTVTGNDSMRTRTKRKISWRNVMRYDISTLCYTCKVCSAQNICLEMMRCHVRQQ